MELFIGNLSHDASPEDIYELLRPFDKEACTKVVERQLEDGNVIIYGHAEIKDDAVAQRAIDALNGKELLGTPILVRQFVDRDEGTPPPKEIRDRRRTSVYTLEAKRCKNGQPA